MRAVRILLSETLVIARLLPVALLIGGGVGTGFAQPQPTQDARRVAVGAIRWDNWRLDSASAATLDDPALRPRVPYFATRRADGRLGFLGNAESTLNADVHYARAAGIDYFIFGYYLATSSWGRNPAAAIALNRALDVYLHLPDRLGVRFALSFNWNFPAADVPAAAQAVVRALAHPDYVRSSDGAPVVYFFVPDLTSWLSGFGGEARGAEAISAFRRQVKAATGSDLYLVALLFGLPKVAPTAMRVGFDAVSTYANALGTEGRAVPYATCAAAARQFWQVAARVTSGGFEPTVTLGWDYRPAARDPAEAAQRPRNPSWCEPATDSEWFGQIRAATAAAASNPHNRRFPGIVVYAWNEFIEGGWIVPTLTEGTRRIAVIANALDRHRAMPPFQMSWPARVDAQRCRIAGEPEALRDAGPGCREVDDPMTMDWPCPPGMHIATDLLRRASAEEAGLSPGVWQERWCAGG